MKRSKFQLILLLCTLTIAIHAQELEVPLLNIGDPAPPLFISEWIKGTPVQQFKKDRLYVVEFWATWCVPCKAAMPHLSSLAHQFKDKITIIGVDIYEEKMKNSSRQKTLSFVENMGNKMDYPVAIGDSNMVPAWINAAGEQNNGIPKTFVVNGEGRLAWIGHPSKLDTVLYQIVTNNWDIKKALANRNLEKYIEKLDEDAYYDLYKYQGDPGNPDSMLNAIKKWITKEPLLKYAPHIAYQTFATLLKINPDGALEYGKELLTKTQHYRYPGYDVIIKVIEGNADKVNILPAVYMLAADAQQVEIDHYSKPIDHYSNPESLNFPRRYAMMAEWYWRADDTSRAIIAQQKAIEALKIRKNDSMKYLATFESRLQLYMNK